MFGLTGLLSGLFAVAAALAPPPPGLAGFNATASGSVNLSSTNCAAEGLVCGALESCQCVEMTGSGTVNAPSGLAGGDVDFLMSVSQQAGVIDGSSEECFPASAVLKLTDESDESDTLSLESAGWACNSPTFTHGLYYSSYDAASGTGRFSTATGNGALTWTYAFADNGGSVQVTGTLAVDPPGPDNAKHRINHR